MFANRTNWELSQNRITKILQEFKQSGRRVLDLTESNPTNCQFNYPDIEIQKALVNQKNLVYSPDTRGLPAAREAIVAYYQEKNIQIRADQIFLTSSTSEGYSFLFRLLANPGETVLFPRPSYPLFEFLVGINDLDMEFYPLDYHGEWQLNYEMLNQMVRPQTRAIVMVNPNNPTGSFVKAKELAALNIISRRHQIPLISDEVFFDYAYDEQAVFPSFAANEENLTFVLGGLSKMLGLPQMKLSWIIINGPSALVKEASQRLEIIADTYLSVNTPVQNALPEWMHLRADIQGQIMARVKTNRDFIRRHFSDSAIGTCLNAEGGWYVTLKLFDSFVEETITENLLLSSQVYVHPGYFFNFETEGHVVVSLLPRPEVFAEGVERLAQYLTR